MSGDINQGLFFKLYAVFLSIDSLTSFVCGRQYSLINDFFHCYLGLSFGKCDNRLNEVKEKIRNNLRIYVDKHWQTKLFPDNIQHSDYLPSIKNNQNLSLAFKELIDAVEQYEKWRGLLNDEQIRIIYKKNLKDRQTYYANESGVFDKLNDELIQSVKFDNNKILKQTLIEFHNAISHLVAVYYGRAQDGKNINRAINHFRRGALDSYKAIIKDFYHIRDNRTYNPLSSLKEVRNKEYKGIGKDNSLCNYYKKLTDKIIATYHS